MEILIIPSVLAISIKIGIFLRYHRSLTRENVDLGIFFLAVFFLNVFEMLSIKAEFAPGTSMLILLAYYCCVIFTVHGFLNVALWVSGFDWHTSRIKLGFNLLLAALILNLIFNRAIVAGVEPLSGYTLTRISGEFYWLFQAYLVIGLVLAVCFLIYGMVSGRSNLVQQKSLVILVSAALPVLMAGSVVGLMAAGVNINGAIFMSLSLSIMLGLMVFAEEKTRLFRLLTLMPFTRERRFHKQLLARITDCVSIGDDSSRRSLNLKQTMKELEGSVVEHVLGYYGGNQKKAACALGVSEATLSRRARAVASRQDHCQNYGNDSMAMTENATSS